MLSDIQPHKLAVCEFVRACSHTGLPISQTVSHHRASPNVTPLIASTEPHIQPSSTPDEGSEGMTPSGPCLRRTALPWSRHACRQHQSIRPARRSSHPPHSRPRRRVLWALVRTLSTCSSQDCIAPPRQGAEWHRRTRQRRRSCLQWLQLRKHSVACPWVRRPSTCPWQGRTGPHPQLA